MVSSRKALIVTVLLVLFSSAFSFYAGANRLVPELDAWVAGGKAPQVSPTSSAKGLDYQKLEKVRGEIEQNFVGTVSNDQLLVGALKGMVRATEDPYSAYYTAEEFKSFTQHFETSFSGIGVYVELSPKTGLVTVVAPMKGTPGEKAGLRAGDVIVTVDTTDVRGMPLEKAVTLIKGPKGSQVKLTVQRPGEEETREFTITRATIEYPTVEYRMADKAAGVGYIQLIEFNEKVSDRVAKAIADLRSQGMTRLILDLRQDPGGLLTEAIDTASLFVPGGKPVLIVEGRNQPRQVYESRGKNVFELPLLVLVDEGSASASEIVAGALKDHKIGVLMGVKTFGKGSVQTFHDFPDGAGIKLTTAHYLTAGGNAINGKGIEPDVRVENPKPVRPGDPGDVQLEEAIRYIQTMKR